MSILPQKPVWLREVIEIILIFLLGTAMSFAFNPNLAERPWESIRLTLSYSGFMWVFFWKGNQYLVGFWNNRISWLEEPGKRFIIGMITVLIYTPSIMYLLNFFFNLFLDVSVDWGNGDILVAIGITCLISFFMFAKEFLNNWRRASLDAERIKREQMATKYESLKNQVNPHFLFNSLNALTNLVYEDQDQAANFIRQLSKVYRYVLDTQSKELVSLKTELTFLNSYVFLQKIRFDDKLTVDISVEGFEERLLPPIALQMLLENAIKHNTIAEEEPLTVQIYIEDESYIVVKNNLQKKRIPLEASSGMGLENIKSRYEFLSKSAVEVTETADEFIVKLPLLALAS
ncbi:MAG: hypothetical protein Roseis2KO_26040 [Roseivirga sp.]